jgi:hypothetical protein
MVLTHKGHLKWVGARSYPLEQAGLMLVGNLYEIYLHSAPHIGIPLTNHMDSLSCMHAGNNAQGDIPRTGSCWTLPNSYLSRTACWARGNLYLN